jgi:hypothetical protein
MTHRTRIKYTDEINCYIWDQYQRGGSRNYRATSADQNVWNKAQRPKAEYLRPRGDGYELQ